MFDCTYCGRQRPANGNPRLLCRADLLANDDFVHIADGMPGKSRVGAILLTRALRDESFAPDVTGLGDLETRVNGDRLVAAMRESLHVPYGKLSQPWVGSFRHRLLTTQRAFREAVLLSEACLEAAEAARPDLVNTGDRAGLLQVARGYCEHITDAVGGPGHMVHLVHVLMPLHRAKPAVIIGSSRDLFGIIALHQDAVAG